MAGVAAPELSRTHEQLRLDAGKTHAARNVLGQFATPYALALDIARAALAMRADPAAPIRFLEPAVGTGAFFSACRDAAAELDESPRILSATGIEIDAAASEAAVRLWSSAGLDVVAADFTRLDPPPPGARANLLLTNPPYTRHHHIGEAKPRLKALVRERLGLEVSGLAGLYAHFMLLAHDWMEDGGTAAWLVPSEFMDVNYGSVLLEYLSSRVTLRRIHWFDPEGTQFSDALVSSAVVMFDKRPPPRGASAMFSFGGSLSAPARSASVGIEQLGSTAKWSALFRAPAAAAADAIPNSAAVNPTASRSGFTIGDLFTIKRGIVTGDNGFFLLPRGEARALGLPDAALTPILPGPRDVPGDVVESDGEGWPVLARSLALVGSDVPVEQLVPASAAFSAYVRAGEERGSHLGYITSRREPWYSHERRDPAPFLCTYMGRKREGGRPVFRVVWNKSRAIAANVWLMLYPKRELSERLAGDAGLAAAVHAALRQAVESVGQGGRVYGGGLHKFEPGELAAVAADRVAAAAGVRGRRQREMAFGPGGAARGGVV